MIRLLVSAILGLIANGVGLIIAGLVLDDFNITTTALITVTVIFTVVEFVLGPLIFKISLQNIPAMTGGIALVTTFVGLLITDIISDGLNISGISTWIIAPLIVWLSALLAGVILPLFMFKKTMQKAKESKNTNIPNQ